MSRALASAWEHLRTKARFLAGHPAFRHAPLRTLARLLSGEGLREGLPQRLQLRRGLGLRREGLVDERERPLGGRVEAMQHHRRRVLVGEGREREQVIYESADLLYHLAVLWRAAGVGLDEVADELARRRPSP